MDDLDVGKQTKKNMKRAEEAPKKMFTLGIGIGRATMGFFSGFMRGEREEGRGREGERRALVKGNGYDERVVAGMPRGVYIQGYGYDRERYGDGANDTSSPRSTSVSVGHRNHHLVRSYGGLEWQIELCQEGKNNEYNRECSYPLDTFTKWRKSLSCRMIRNGW